MAKPTSTPGFSTAAKLLNRRLEDAVAATNLSTEFDYFSIGRRSRVVPVLAFFSLAASIGDLRRRHADTLTVGVPVLRSDVRMPISVLAKPDGVNVFVLNYFAKRGPEKSLIVDPEVFTDRFESRHRPPVDDLIGKLDTFQVMPWAAKPQDELEAGFHMPGSDLTE